MSDVGQPLTASLRGDAVLHNIARQFSRAAPRYDNCATIQHTIATAGLNRVPGNIGTLLDIGCGTGRNTANLAARGFTVTGVDLAPGMVAYASQRFARLTFKIADAQALPFHHNTFDRVFSSMALQWCACPRQVIGEVARVLAPQGIACLTIMVSGSFAELDAARAASGLAPATNNMASFAQWEEASKQCNVRLIESTAALYIDTFTDILELLRSIKTVGAGTRLTSSPTPPLSRPAIAALADAYPRTADGGLPLSYQVAHLILEK
ncbi:methyltransferase domain-containing protein [Salinimonas sediminis]|uniref:Methyltransferase domain-containing protein n=1 Tax=Salinimonas sediminis TaxID=2303538 RepID=A0A346NKD3_9ALTE|nr:methyltransferase domain-containing protein [Salinimonas sediminis]AXR05990.1 methyltransferase domain-containing protein [Salinimonas sediminis]